LEGGGRGTFKIKIEKITLFALSFNSFYFDCKIKLKIKKKSGLS
jgi:hypothetical protein